MKRASSLLVLMVIFGMNLQAMDGLPFGSTDQISKEPRSYELGISHDQLDDLYYALTSLAYHSFSAILVERVQLQEAMVRVDEVHPLHFMAAVFRDSKLITCIHLIREKQWLWRHFFIRVKRTLDEEMERDNIRPEYVQDFCDELNLECDTVLNHIIEQNWDWLIEHLFEKFPTVEE